MRSRVWCGIIKPNATSKKTFIDLSRIRRREKKKRSLHPIRKPRIPLQSADDGISSLIEKFHSSEPFLNSTGEEYVAHESPKKKDGYVINENGHYIFAKDTRFYNYRISNLIGQGVFSSVYKVYNLDTRQFSALKVMRDREYSKYAFETETKSLEKIGKSKYIAAMRSYKTIPNKSRILALSYIEIEHLGASLRRVIDSKLSLGNFTVFKMVAECLLNSIRIMDEKGIVHCDIKPDNILTYKLNQYKLVDFGNSIATGFPNEDPEYFPRYYRPPEVILGFGEYTTSMDIWSVGVTLFEVFTGEPPFEGEDNEEMMQCFISSLGFPPQKMAKVSNRWTNFLLSVKLNIVERIGFRKRLESVVRIGPETVDKLSTVEMVINTCFNYIPSNRMKSLDDMLVAIRQL